MGARRSPSSCRRQGFHGSGPHPQIEACSEHLVNHNFLCTQPNLLWVCDVTDHPSRTGNRSRSEVLDAFTALDRGWSIETSQNTNLVANARKMALGSCDPAAWHRFQADHDVQFASWTFTNRFQQAGLMPRSGQSVTATTTR